MFRIYYFNKVNSTNEKAKGFEENSVITANEQTKGKGRFNRDWSSSRGGIYMSIVLGLEDIKMQYLTFIAAISVFKAIKDYGIKTIIKWPNDLIYDGKKVCGILTKSIEKKVIVGIGVNTNNKIGKPLNKKGISLNKIIKKEINNKIIINRILFYFEKYIKLLRNKKYKKIINDWKRNSFLGSEVRVKSLGKSYYGKAFDVDRNCFLILKDKKGRKIKIMEGDVFII